MYEKNCVKMVGSIKREKAIGKKGVKKVLSVVLACSFCFGVSSTAFAASEYQDTITVNEEGAVEKYIGNYATKDNVTPEQDITNENKIDTTNISPYATYTISNISAPSSWSLFTPVSSYVAYPGTVSVTKGESTTITSSVTGGGGVDIKFLKANVAKTVGDSVTFTTSQTISYPAAPATKGRIILRYKQEQYTYTITKLGKKYPGSAFTAATDQYYALQSVGL